MLNKLLNLKSRVLLATIALGLIVITAGTYHYTSGKSSTIAPTKTSSSDSATSDSVAGENNTSSNVLGTNSGRALTGDNVTASSPTQSGSIQIGSSSQQPNDLLTIGPSPSTLYTPPNNPPPSTPAPAPTPTPSPAPAPAPTPAPVIQTWGETYGYNYGCPGRYGSVNNPCYVGQTFHIAQFFDVDIEVCSGTATLSNMSQYVGETTPVTASVISPNGCDFTITASRSGQYTIDITVTTSANAAQKTKTWVNHTFAYYQ